jgi:LDH2 family malate/lactate/ureidoglycolate dehydrogenase
MNMRNGSIAMADNLRRFPREGLTKLCSQIFTDYGYSDKDAKFIVDVLIEADMMNVESHGLQRLELYCNGIDIGRIKVQADIKTVAETPLSATIDADAAMGQLVGRLGMHTAIKKAKACGIGFVVIRNSNHYGMAGYYSMLAAREGMLGISMTNSQALVVPTFGREPMLGTNPIAITMPGNPMYHFDMATSVCTAGKLEVYSKKGAEIPSGWLIDWDGKSSTNPKDFLKIRTQRLLGGILPIGGEGEMLGGYKGYGLSLLVELFTGVLAGGVTSLGVRKMLNEERCSHMFFALDYSILGVPGEIEKHFSDYLVTIQNSAKALGADHIFIPGEKEFLHYADAEKYGVPLNSATCDSIKDLCLKHGVKGCRDYF